MTVVSEILLMQGLVDEDDVRVSFEQFGDTKALDRDLVKRGLVTEAEYAEALAYSLNLSYINLEDYPLDEEIIELLPGNFLRKNLVIPLEKTQNSFSVAMFDPENLVAIDDMSSIVGLKVVPCVAALDAIQIALGNYIRSDDELSDLSATMEAMADAETDNEDIDVDSDEPVVRFVNLVINQAIQDRASDIHIEPQQNEVRVRYRIDGVLYEVHNAPKLIQDGIVSRLKIMSNINIAEKRVPQDGRLTVNFNGKGVDLRVATLPTVWGENVVMRILDNTATTMTLQQLDMSTHNFNIFSGSFKKPHGMILVTGPTGSGKSTTLYTTLNTISTPEVKVITVEDPVEYRLAGINQIPVNNRSGMTFDKALRSILRSDPDIVLVGEIRDRQTAQISIEASLTGHLVLSTLHTNDAPSAITRLVEMGVEPFLVGSAMDCIVAQRLARRLCSKCKIPYQEEASHIEALGIDANVDTVFYKSNGCSFCNGNGYKGRLALHEVMNVSENIKKMTIERDSAQNIKMMAVEEGMTTLKQDGWIKVLQGLTSIDEVLRVVA